MNRQIANQIQQISQTTAPVSGSILQRKCACGNHTMAGGECEACSKKQRLGLQTKLKINEPGDIYEREADRIADRVLATPAHDAVSGAPPRIQRFSGQSNGQLDAAPASIDQALASPGRPLEPALRQNMEQRFGHDFSRVRVHSSAAAEQSARDVNANAYTMGHDIVFGAGLFAPGTHEGQRLIAHELTHVAQQRAHPGRVMVQRQPRTQEGTEAPWQKHLDAILPRHVGVIEDINRVVTLLDALGDAELARVVELIYQSPDATAFVREYGVPGLLALHETLTGPRPNVLPDQLDVPAARFLLTAFSPRTSPASAEETPPEVFPVEAVREAYVRYHRNALLDKEDEQGNKVRRNCIAIVRDLVPQLFDAEPRLARRITAALSKLHGQTLTMPHAGAVLADLGVAGKPIDIRFKDGNGNKDEPKELSRSAWDTILAEVGDVQGWHIFGMSVMDGHHSVTIFVDNAPDGRRVYWADQWAIGRDDNFGQQANAISGFRRYEEAGSTDGSSNSQTRSGRMYTAQIPSAA